jgi:hypothetical protein
MKDSRVMVGAFFGLGMACAGIAAVASPPIEEQVARPAAPVAVQRVAFSPAELRDETVMVLAGAALIGLAAAVRRAA